MDIMTRDIEVRGILASINSCPLRSAEQFEAAKKIMGASMADKKSETTNIETVPEGNYRLQQLDDQVEDFNLRHTATGRSQRHICVGGKVIAKSDQLTVCGAASCYP